MSQASDPVESVDQLVSFLREGEKPPERWKVGTEHEKIGLYTGTWAPVPYEGDRGIGALLQRIAEREHWEPVFEGPNPIALTHEGASITLEPGGQLELSGAPLRTIHETCDEFHTHLSLMKQLCEPFGIVFLGLGINPLYPVSEIPVMPKARYQIMRRYLPGQGSLALEMMFATATVQANFDFADEADMIEKLRTALAVSPVVSAIFANSSLSEGKANGFVSRRIHAWQHTDPDRTGMLDLAFSEDFGYRSYVEWALDVPMFFVIRDGTYHDATQLTFRQFVERGFEGHRATLVDFDRHLTTLFPEVRLKRFLEVRGADAVPPGLTCSLPALWKGLLYDARSRQAAWDRVAHLGSEAREAARGDVARRGLAARYGEEPVIEIARDLARLATEGLARIGHAGRRDADETGFLDPIHEQLAEGRSPGQVVVERWEGDWQRSVDRLIEYAQY
ncbi:MAG: glutamate--cysteine ligase [Myxococcota bacterium]